jgi:hypothetical protein
MAELIPLHKNWPIIPQGLYQYFSEFEHLFSTLDYKIARLISRLTYGSGKKFVRISCKDLAEMTGVDIHHVYAAMFFLRQERVIERIPRVKGRGKYGYGIHSDFLPKIKKPHRGFELKRVK